MTEEAIKIDAVQIAAKMVRDAVGAMSAKFSAYTKAGLAEKQDIATMPTKVSDFTNDTGFQNAQQVENAIDAKISSAYKAGGSATMATLPTLNAAKLGVVVNMSEDFVTTADFLEGAGKSYPAGTNVVVALAGENVYKYDVLAGFVDLSGYVQDTRKVGGVPLLADIPVSLTGDSSITVTNTGTASAIGYSITLTNSGVTAGSKGDATAQMPAFGATFKALSATVDAKGRLTALGEHNITIPNATATTSAAGLMSAGDKSKLDKYASKGSATKGVYIDNNGAPQNMTYELNANVPANFAPATAAPLMDGTAAVGTSAKYAREDHRHPVDTSRASAADFAALCDLISRMEIYCEASGNPATFSDAKAANVRELSVTITPTQSGSGDPSPTNIRPISGVDSVTVHRRGRNLFPQNTVSFPGGVGSVTLPFPAPLPAGIYTFSANLTSTYQPTGVDVDGILLHIMYTDDSYLQSRFMPGGRVTFTADTGTKKINSLRFYIGNNYVNSVNHSGAWSDIQFEAGSDATGYQPYDTYTIPLVDSSSNPLTVYGGTLDVTTGTLTVTYGVIDLGALNYTTTPYDGMLVFKADNQVSDMKSEAASFCEIYKRGQLYGDFCIMVGNTWYGNRPVTIKDSRFTDPADLKAALNGVKCVYELAAPLTYQLTPQQLSTLAGYNAVSSDAGAVDVTYKADTSLVFGGG